MTAGLVLGGVKFTIFGIQVVAKLDVLTLATGDDYSGREAEQQALPDSDSSSDDDNDRIAVMVRDGPNAEPRRMVVNRAMMLMQMQQADGASDHEGDED